MSSNPYAPPTEHLHATRSSWAAAGSVCFWLATFSLVLGFVTLFLPSFPPGIWLVLACVLFAVAILLGDRRHRLAAVVGLVLCVLLTVVVVRNIRNQSHQRAIQEMQRLEQARRAKQ